MYRVLMQQTILTLLATLVLSSGEGVRLFPIPTPAASGPAVEQRPEAFSASPVQRYQYAARMTVSLLKRSQPDGSKIRHGGNQIAGSAFSTNFGVEPPLQPDSPAFYRSAPRKDPGYPGLDRSRGPPSC